MKKTFCDRCDQQLIEPDENVNFLGNGALTTGDVCWPCRLAEVVDAYNAKVEEEPERPKAKLTFVPNRKSTPTTEMTFTPNLGFSEPDSTWVTTPREIKNAQP